VHHVRSWWIRLSLVGLALLGVGYGLGFGVSHWTQPQQWARLSPASTQPRDETAAARRAIALVVGQTRAGDEMTFDAWYRARLNRMAPGIRFEYEALLSGNDICGFWSVYATVIPGPALGPPNEVDVLNRDGIIGSVDEVTGTIQSLDKFSAGASSYRTDDHCLSPLRATHAWLDDFRAGASP
jgi:hypothetical protein